MIFPHAVAPVLFNISQITQNEAPKRIAVIATSTSHPDSEGLKHPAPPSTWCQHFI